jgi:hypothetical protein
MTLRLSRHFLRAGARLLVFALVYSALSPVLASLLPGDRARVSARLLGLQTDSVEWAAMICHEDGAATTAPGSPASPTDHHGNGGVYCSFCLAAAQVTALPLALPQARPVPVRDTPIKVLFVLASLEIHRCAHGARGPPPENC